MWLKMGLGCLFGSWNPLFGGKPKGQLPVWCDERRPPIFYFILRAGDFPSDFLRQILLASFDRTER